MKDEEKKTINAKRKTENDTVKKNQKHKFEPEKLKAVLIDMDGTLLNSMDVLYKVYRDFLHEYGHRGTKAEFKQLTGPSINEVISMIKKYGIEASFNRVKGTYRAILKKHYAEDIELYPGALEFLDRAKS